MDNTDNNSAKPDSTVYLVQSASAAERRILADWIRDHGDATAERIDLQFPRDQASIVPPDFGSRLQRDDDPVMSPIRVAWLPKSRGGRRDIKLIDLLLIGDPRSPRGYARDWIARHQPDRYRVLVGEPARLSALREVFDRHSGSSDKESFSAFVVRRATLSLEREESKLLGPQYKMPRLVREDIRASARFREGLAKEAERTGTPMARAEELADIALRELASGYSPLGVDINRTLGRFFYRQAYDEKLDYDLKQVEQMRRAFQGKPGVILPSHRTNLDAGVMSNAFHELDLPKTSTLGGINMAFWPMGYLFRRSGIIFIRRDTRSDPLYRWILKEYLGYILEKGFSLEWYIEGGRSRTGKALPPKLGLLKYAVEAYRDGRIEDLMLVPAAMTYDYINDVHDYAREARGVVKSSENFQWYVNWFKSLRGQRYGRIYVRFGEPVSVAKALGSPENARKLDDKEYSLALHKLSFEVSWRINQVTPMTSTALITMTLLSAFNHALSLPQLCALLKSFVRFADQHNLPMTTNARALLTEKGVRNELQRMIERRLVLSESEGPDVVYTIGHDQHIAASFFRNSIIHHFLIPAICEVALLAAGKRNPEEAVDAFWTTAFELRDALKFDFFFLEKTQYQGSVEQFLAKVAPQWQEVVQDGALAVSDLLGSLQPLTSESVLRSFLESYWVVGHCLQLRPRMAHESREDFVRFCAGTARQYLLQRRIHSQEAGSMLLYPAGIELAQNRGLIKEDDSAELRAAQEQFTHHMRDLLDLVDEVHLVGRRAFNERLQNAD